MTTETALVFVTVCGCVQFIAYYSGSASASGSGHPPGHLQPLGAHRPAEGSVDVVEGFLDPRTFYEKYVKASKPVLFKGAAKGIPAYELWQDSYLEEKFGSLQVDVESGRKENRSNELLTMSMSELLRDYKTADVYMVQNALDAMKDDLSMIKPLLCGGFQELLDSSIIWFSGGATKSVLHSDGLYNINCQLDGSKEIVMIDKKYKDLVENEEYVVNGAYSGVDVEAVDMYRFPSLGRVPWWQATMERGDCFYIPYMWYHTVASSASRNLAVNLWFHCPTLFDEESCAKMGAPLPDHVPLAQFTLHNGNFTLDTNFRILLFDEFDGRDISREDISRTWSKIPTEVELTSVFNAIDENGDGLMTAREIQSVDILALLKKYPKLLAAVNAWTAEEQEEEEVEEGEGREEEEHERTVDHEEL